ncbi:Ku70/Ku80 beta-barrel domain-containing protein [Besnoitia besnoiti]|uniref:Ku70/Ku80 beta-barrel domain-containing protein n=1 Tax=Besnoitia besnoiti TaxID=94643 RepID=A0A2A9MAI9_BESBE|nr:Ku70/Ku80 beta-barrel domain-containing protein [Besnoitia besnoiti]PFH34214.1 Ku70/Ku80 beta-barrel domain-containing protein [Besnoitia besnoiti]
MALPGQSFKRVLVLLLDCGVTMQQPLRGDLPAASYALEAATAPAFPPPSVGASLASASMSTVASRGHPLSAPSPRGDSAAPFADMPPPSSFRAMKNAVLVYVQHLAATSAKLDVGIVCFGSAKTNSPLAAPQEGSEGAAEDDPGYQHVDVSVQPSSASWEHVRAIETLENSDNRSDAIDGVVVAVDTVEKVYGPKLTQNDVSFLIVSDCRSTLPAPEDIMPVRDHLRRLGIRTYVLLVDGALPAYPPVFRLPLSSSSRVEPTLLAPHTLPSLAPLALLASTLVPLRSFLTSPFLQLFFTPRKRLSTKCRVNLQISDAFSIPVYVFVKTRKETLPTLRKRVFVGRSASQAAKRRKCDFAFASSEPAEEDDAATLEGDLAETGDAWRDLKVQRFYYRANDPDRKPVRLGDQGRGKQFEGISLFGGADDSDQEDRRHAGGDKASGELVQRLYAYRYGRQLVAVSAVEQQALKGRTTAGLVVLGVTKRDVIQKWWNLGATEYVTCALNNRPSLVALRSLVLALERLDSVLLCSFVWRSGYPARLVALLPHIGARGSTPDPHNKSRIDSDAVKRKQEEGGGDRGGDGEEGWRYGLHLIYLPVAEDMLELRLPPLPSVTPNQLRAVEDLVESLTLPGAAPLRLGTDGEGDAVSSKADREVSQPEDSKDLLDEERKEAEASLRALQPPASSPAGWQTNPAMDIAADPVSHVKSPSPPCSSSVFSSFLPEGIANFASEETSLALHKIHNPALQRYYQLLVYRHYNPPSPPASVGDDGGNAEQERHVDRSGDAADVHTRILPSLWSRLSPVEQLFTHKPPGMFKEDAGETQEAYSEEKAPLDADLAKAFPLATSPEAQRAMLRHKREQRKLLFGEVIKKQKQLHLHDVRVTGEEASASERHDAAAQDSQRAKERREEQERLERAVEEKEREEKIEALNALHVNSVNPVRDFQRLLEVKETDLTERAIQEMTDMIWRFLRAAAGPQRTSGDAEAPHTRRVESQGPQSVRRQQHLGKALACVEALREGCRKELEGAKFNDFLRELRTAADQDDAATGGDALPAFWQLMKSRRVALITNAEDPRVEVDPSKSLSFYDAHEENSATEAMQAAGAPRNVDALDDLLDLVE